LRAFPNFQAHVAETMVDTDRVAVRLVMQGTNTGEYRGLPEPTGRHAIWEAMAIFRLSADKIVEIRGTADRMSMLIQLGILPDLG
jgi:predicted ester cyclase